MLDRIATILLGLACVAQLALYENLRDKVAAMDDAYLAAVADHTPSQQFQDSIYNTFDLFTSDINKLKGEVRELKKKYGNTKQTCRIIIQ